MFLLGWLVRVAIKFGVVCVVVLYVLPEFKPRLEHWCEKLSGPDRRPPRWVSNCWDRFSREVWPKLESKLEYLCSKVGCRLGKDWCQPRWVSVIISNCGERLSLDAWPNLKHKINHWFDGFEHFIRDASQLEAKLEDWLAAKIVSAAFGSTAAKDCNSTVKIKQEKANKVVKSTLNLSETAVLPKKQIAIQQEGKHSRYSKYPPAEKAKSWRCCGCS